MVYLPSLNKMVTIILWIVNLTSGYCPDELLIEVFSCLHNLTHGSDMLFPSADVELMKQHCETGGFRDSVECLEKVYSQCNSPKDMERLMKYAVPAAWQSGFNRFCDNINEYTRRKSCVEQQNRALGTCIDSNVEPVTRDSEEELHLMSLEEREDKSTERLCTLFYWMNHCVNKPSKCGPEIGAILSDFVGGITPPICRDFSLPSSSSNIYKNNLLIISSLLLTFFLINNFFTSIF